MQTCSISNATSLSLPIQSFKINVSKLQRSHCFLEISIDKEPAGRLLIEVGITESVIILSKAQKYNNCNNDLHWRCFLQLFSDKVPKTSENFKQLCTGEKGNSDTSEYPLHYKNTLMHRIVPNGWIQAGDIWPPHKGNGGESVYGPVFEGSVLHMQKYTLFDRVCDRLVIINYSDCGYPRMKMLRNVSDESFKVKHDKRGIIGMANKGRHTNGSQFYICLQPTPWMDTKYVAFG